MDKTIEIRTPVLRLNLVVLFLAAGEEKFHITFNITEKCMECTQKSLDQVSRESLLFSFTNSDWVCLVMLRVQSYVRS